MINQKVKKILNKEIMKIGYAGKIDGGSELLNLQNQYSHPEDIMKFY